jgi:ADP-ribosyl-[dinitrogen reductase] hydrolase
MEDKKDFILGAVFGQAIGDALGHPIEFKKTHKVEDLLPNSLFTDDTQMFCAIGEALIANPPHIDEERFMRTLSAKFDEWRHRPLGGSHRAPGGNCMDAVRRLGAGVHWTKAGGLDYKGNGSAMRSGIVGTFYWNDPQYAFRIGALTSVCTHNNLESLLGAGMVAYLVAASIKHGNFPRAVAEGLLEAADFERSVPFYPRQVKFGPGFADQNPWYALSAWGAAYALGGESGLSVPEAVSRLADKENIVLDGAVVPAVAEAIFFNARSQFYHDAVISAVNNSDDTDTIGAITGTIAGARAGLGGIHDDWIRRIELPDYLRALGERIVIASAGWSTAWTASQDTDSLLDEAVQAAADGDIDDDALDGIIELNDTEGVVYCRHNQPTGRCIVCGLTGEVKRKFEKLPEEDEEEFDLDLEGDYDEAANNN